MFTILADLVLSYDFINSISTRAGVIFRAKSPMYCHAGRLAVCLRTSLSDLAAEFTGRSSGDGRLLERSVFLYTLNKEAEWSWICPGHSYWETAVNALKFHQLRPQWLNWLPDGFRGQMSTGESPGMCVKAIKPFTKFHDFGFYLSYI